MKEETSNTGPSWRRERPMHELRPADVARLAAAALESLLDHEWMDVEEDRKGAALSFIDAAEEVSATLGGLVKRARLPGSEEVAYGALRLLDAMRVFAEIEASKGLMELPHGGFNPLGFGSLETCPHFGDLAGALLVNYIRTLELLAQEVAHA